MEKNFNKALSFVFKWEGGLTIDENDPGGTTKWGISQRSYPSLNIESLTREEAARIYKKDYWDKVGGDTLPFPFDVLAFDMAVNCGVGRASRLIGKATCGKDYLFKRIEYYTKLTQFNLYGKGWVNRCIDLYKLIEEMKV